MARRAEALKKLLVASQQASSQAQRSFLKAEDRLAELEEREAKRASRAGTRGPAIEGRH